MRDGLLDGRGVGDVEGERLAALVSEIRDGFEAARGGIG